MPKINREAFLRVLEAVQPGLATREILEQSTCFIFSGGRVLAMNDEVAACAPSPLEDVAGAVRADRLLDLLRKLPDEELEVSAGDGALNFTGKRRGARVVMESEILHPLVGTVPSPDEWRPLHKDFAEAVSVVGLCASADQTTFARVCVHVTPKWVEAHDGVQACRWRLKTGFAGDRLVRQASVKHVTAMGMAEFAEDDSWVHFRNPDGVVLSCRRYVDDYPADEKGEFESEDGTLIALPKGLAEAADRASVFSGENADANLVRVELKPNKLRLVGEGASGSYWESKKVNYDGPALSFLIAPALLADVVKRHAEVRISAERLRVRSDRFSYVAALFKDAKAEAVEEEPAEELEGATAE